MHHVAGRGDEQAAQDAAAALGGELLERVEVEHGLVDRHRHEVLHLEGERLLQLVDRHPGQVDLAHDDLLVRDADDDLLAAELGVRPELLDGGGDGVGVDDLAVADGTLGQGHLAELLEGDLTLAERQLGGAHARGPDVETDGGSTCHDASPPTGGWCRVVTPDGAMSREGIGRSAGLA